MAGLKKILFILFIAVIFIFLGIKSSSIALTRSSATYNSIVGNAYEENGEENDDNKPKLENIKVNLYSEDGQLLKSTRTDENGKYEFKDLPEGNYKIGFEWGQVDKDYIDNVNANDTEKIKKIQSILKYNAQDYSLVGDTVTETETETRPEEKVDDVQVVLVIDKSGSMIGNRIEKTRELAEKIVRALLVEKRLGSSVNVEIGLVTFDSTATVNSELTTDWQNELIHKIQCIQPSGGTNILDSLKKATEDIKNFNKKNRFIFFLSDGWDRNGDAIKNYIDNRIIGDNINMYTLYVGAESEFNIIQQYFGSTELINVEDEELNNIVIEIVNDFIQFVEYKLDLENNDVIEEDEEKEKNILEYFANIQYNNTVIFNAIDMEVNSENIDKFKNYAKLLTEVASTKAISARVCRIKSGTDGTEGTFLKGPDLKLKRRPETKIKLAMVMTEMKIIATNGSIIGLKTNKPSADLPLLESQEEKMLYGAEVGLEYTLGVKNLTENNDYSKLQLLCFIPSGFTYNGILSVINESNPGRNVEITEIITADNIEEKLRNYYDIKYDNELESTNLYNEIVNNGKDAIIITIEYPEDNLFKNNEYTILKFKINKLLSSAEDTAYKGYAEVFQYANNGYRRMENIDKNTGLTKTIVAGNGVMTETDGAKTKNTAIIIPPTGKDKRMYYIYGMIVTLIIIGLYIVIKKKKL